MSIIEQAPAVAAYTVDQFCAAHNICRTRLYALWGEGRGPRCGVDVFAAGLTPTIQFDARAGKEKPGTVSSGTGRRTRTCLRYPTLPVGASPQIQFAALLKGGR